MKAKGDKGAVVDVVVSRGPRDIVRIEGTGKITCWCRNLSVRGASQVLRVLLGQTDGEILGDGEGERDCDPLAFRKFFDPSPGYMLYDRDGDKPTTLFSVDLDGAMALKLALAKAIQDCTYVRYREVWLLLSTCVLTGDAAVDGADQLGTRAFAYATREEACDHLREFMRPDVDDSRPDGAWDDGTETVDDVLDSIFEGNDDLGSDGDGRWTYDGSVRSYEWRLMRLGVRG